MALPAPKNGRGRVGFSDSPLSFLAQARGNAVGKQLSRQLNCISVFGICSFFVFDPAWPGALRSDLSRFLGLDWRCFGCANFPTRVGRINARSFESGRDCGAWGPRNANCFHRKIWIAALLDPLDALEKTTDDMYEDAPGTTHCMMTRRQNFLTAVPRHEPPREEQQQQHSSTLTPVD